MRSRFLSDRPATRSALTIVTAALLLALVPLSSASADTLKTLHSFCKTDTCTGGANSWAGLLMDSSGNLYGTAFEGGKSNDGVVFELIPNADKTKYTELVLKNFCSRANCTDGGGPVADLIMDVDGALYGTTQFGGRHGGGVAFKLRHDSHAVNYGVIHSFCAKGACADGENPEVRACLCRSGFRRALG
jgi:uncharacterized repeat protein (TIGR03803 family)